MKIAKLLLNTLLFIVMFFIILLVECGIFAALAAEGGQSVIYPFTVSKVEDSNGNNKDTRIGYLDAVTFWGTDISMNAKYPKDYIRGKNENTWHWANTAISAVWGTIRPIVAPTYDISTISECNLEKCSDIFKDSKNGKVYNAGNISQCDSENSEECTIHWHESWREYKNWWLILVTDNYIYDNLGSDVYNDVKNYSINNTDDHLIYTNRSAKSKLEVLIDMVMLNNITPTTFESIRNYCVSPISVTSGGYDVFMDIIEAKGYSKEEVQKMHIGATHKSNGFLDRLFGRTESEKLSKENFVGDNYNYGGVNSRVIYSWIERANKFNDDAYDVYKLKFFTTSLNGDGIQILQMKSATITLYVQLFVALVLSIYFVCQNKFTLKRTEDNENEIHGGIKLPGFKKRKRKNKKSKKNDTE